MPSLYALLFVIHRIYYLLVSTYIYTRLSWKQLNTHEHKVSFPFVLLLVSLTGEEGKVPEAIFGGCRHGNDCIHMRTKFHLHVCYIEQV